MLSILRIMVGLLFLEHGLAKILDFPHPPNHAPYALFTLNPGLQGLLELVGGFLLALGLFTRSVAFVLAGDMALGYLRDLPDFAAIRCNRCGGENAKIHDEHLGATEAYVDWLVEAFEAVVRTIRF